MATNTVPIEIVLQDPNNPIVPTPDNPSDNPGENTNISVPDTALGTGGYTTKDGSSNIGNIFTGSNATVSIASIVVLVLALGAIVTLLVRRYQKHKKCAENKETKAKVRKGEKLATAATATLAVLAAAVLLGNICMTATNAATSEGDTTLTTPDKIQIIANRYEDVTIVASTKVVSYATTDTTFGYKIFMSMAGDNANLYLDGDTSSENYFTATENAGLDDNSWGYSLNGKANYSAMPLASDPLMAQQNINAVEDEEFTVYYTMKADKDMPFGVYSGEIAYDIQGFSGFPASLTTMQGMTSAICDAVYTPSGTETVVPTATLKDTRDNKTYEIAKLADGNCWMTQNLDLDLSTETALTTANTNISSSWTPERSTITTGNLSSTTWPSNSDANNDPYSYDPGDVYYYTSGDTSQDKTYESLTLCMKDHTESECKHYHAGNYYSWSAAVASNDTSAITTQYTNVDTDICPAGWELPKGPNAESSTVGNEFDTLITSTDGLVGDAQGCGGSCIYRNYLPGGFNAIRTAPLWLARSGDVEYGSLHDTGYGGYYWSSTVYSRNGAYSLGFGSSGVNPAGDNNRYYGYSVRCIAQ